MPASTDAPIPVPSPVDRTHPATGLVVVVPAWAQAFAAATSTVRSVLDVLPDARVEVVDVDGAWVRVGDETLVTARDLGIDEHDLRRRAFAVGTAAVAVALVADAIAARPGTTVLALAPGVVLLREPLDLLAAARDAGVAVIARTTAPADADGTWPTEADVVAEGALHPAMLAVHDPDPAFLTTWRASWRAPHAPWLDAAASRVGARVVPAPGLLLGPWNLTSSTRVEHVDGPLRADGRPIDALDLTQLDHDRPWSLAPDVTLPPRARLSDHPALAAVCARVAAAGAALPAPSPLWDARTLGDGTPADDVVRGLVRDAVLAGDDVPDPVTQAGPTLEWLTSPPAPGEPGRYLRALRGGRPDLCDAFPGVPGEHTAPFLDWARTYGRNEVAYAQALVDAAVAAVGEPPAATPQTDARPEGVNVVGYLGGDIGIGEAARLVLDALRAAGVPTRAVPVEQHLQSRRRPYPQPTGPVYDTTVVCVNADLTPGIARTVPTLLSHGARVGMWYWEVEHFPPELGAAAALLDEVWVATDFVRAAVEPHVTVPVRVVTPPLPQARPVTVAREDLGLPADRPVALFVFDYLSTVERKNPIGVIEAFRRAFAPDEGPVLVLKSINGDRRPTQAERVRLRARAEPDVVLIEDYLDSAERDALVARCDVYVSLHRAEGLGLTMAEAMSYGKPVVATGYGGNLQFMTEENSFLVPFSRVPVGPGAAPYPAASPWAEPDLDAAARLLRAALLDTPEEAARRGARAARDVAELWSPPAVAEAWRAAVAAARAPAEPSPAPRRPARWTPSMARRATGRR